MEDTGYELRFMKDVYAPNATCARPLRAMNRILYCHSGSFETLDGDRIGPDQAWYGAQAVIVRAGGDGAEIWRWELTTQDTASALELGAGIESRLDLVEPVTTIENAHRWLMRCDSVKFPPKGCAFTHTHQGPGIRVLREGKIRIDADQDSHHYGPGDAWFEAGPDPVFAQAAEQGCTCFVRVMILPSELKGKSSIRYVNDEDQDKPKSQRYKGYVDEFIEH